MTKKPLLLFPIEIKAREFPSRLFLAGLAVKAGYHVIIGKSKTLHRHLYKFPRGIIIENDATPRSFRFFQKARKMGFKIVAWDEESLVTLTDDIYASLRVCPKTVSQIEGFFCRGDGDYAAVSKAYPDIKDQLVKAGNPRLDILKPKWTGKIPHQDRPKTILINSRFSIVNPYYISPEKAKANVFTKFGIARDSETGKHIESWLDHARDMFFAFAELTEKIAQTFPNYKIIIRPHPSENHAFWKDLADKYDNCQSLYEGAASDWFLKADCLIHNSCTTAIEASLSGLPSFSYLPAGDNIYDAQLPNSVSERYYTTEEMLERLESLKYLNENIRESTSTFARESLMDHIAGIEGGTSASCILDHIETITYEPDTLSILGARLYDLTKTNLSLIKHKILKIGKKDKNLETARAGYANQKYPGTDNKEIEDLLKKYGYDRFEVKEFKHEWHMISPI